MMQTQNPLTGSRYSITQSRLNLQNPTKLSHDPNGFESPKAPVSHGAPGGKKTIVARVAGRRSRRRVLFPLLAYWLTLKIVIAAVAKPRGPLAGGDISNRDSGDDSHEAGSSSLKVVTLRHFSQKRILSATPRHPIDRTANFQ